MGRELTQADERTIRFVDLCAGLGGFHRGVALAEATLRQAGTSGWSFQCVLAAETDPSLRRLYVENFPSVEPAYRSEFPAGRVASLLESLDDPKLRDAADMYDEEGRLAQVHGDIAVLVDEEGTGLRLWPDASAAEDFVVPEHDLLCAGFPCQPFSKSGTQLGFSDLRGTVFHLIAVILKERRPDLVLLENVGNFDRHDGGNTWRAVKETLSRLDYEVVATRHMNSDPLATGLLSPHHIGLPHHRERFFIVAQQRNVSWIPSLHERVPFPRRPRTVGEREEADQHAAAELTRIVKESWRSEPLGAVRRAQIPAERVKAINHWNVLLATLAEDDAAGREPTWRSSMPSFPIWGYELDPFQWYPIDTNPRDLLGDPIALAANRAGLLQDATSRVSDSTGSTVDLLDHGPSGARAFLSEAEFSLDVSLAWIQSWPAYASARKKWPPWKRRFIEQNREWALQLWSRLDPAALRAWLDTLFEQVPAASNQKLEWNCKGDELELWGHVLQFRPSGLRVKRFHHVPALVAMTTTQIPVVPILDDAEPADGRAPGAGGRHLLRSEALQLQGFPPDWRIPSGKEPAFRAFGNAVHCELVSAIVQSWLGPEGASTSQMTMDLGGEAAG